MNARRRSVLLALALVVALLGAGSVAGAGAQEVTPEERTTAMVRPAVLYLETVATAKVIDDYGDVWGPYVIPTSCSGFVVSPDGFVGTAGHCVDTASQSSLWKAALGMAINDYVSVWEAEEDLVARAYTTWKVEGIASGSPMGLEVFAQQGVAVSGEKTGKALAARVIEVKAFEQGDVALLKVEASNLPTALLATEQVPIGTPVLSIGYPASTDYVTDATYEPTFKDGKVSAQKTRLGGLFPVYELSSALSGGMSGGPTVDMQGRIIGVNSFQIAGEEQQFNFVSASSLVRELLDRNGVKNVLGPTDVSYRAGLDAYFKGDYGAAIAKFDQVLTRTPSHQQAQEYKAKATEKQAAAPPTTPAAAVDEDAGGSKLSTAGVAILALLALVAVGGVLLVVRARRRRYPTAGIRVHPELDQSAAPDQPPIEKLGDARASVFCSECGSRVDDAAKFCAGCGTSVGHHAQT